MIRFLVAVGIALLVGAVVSAIVEDRKSAPAKTETLNCARVKEVAPGGKINYLCEVRK